MADIEPQANHLPGNWFPRSIAHPQHNNHVLHNAGVPPTASGGQLEGQWEHVLPASSVENDVVQGALQDPQHINVTNYGIADYPELPGVSEYLTVPYTYSNIGLGQGVPQRDEVIFQENQGNDRASYAPQGVVPGPTQPTLPGPSAHRTPVLDQQAAENLRRLASRCVHHPDSQVDVVRMEPGTAGRYKVVIVLEMIDFL